MTYLVGAASTAVVILVSSRESGSRFALERGVTMVVTEGGGGREHGQAGW